MSIFSQPVTVFRKGSKSFVDGSWVGPDDEEFTIMASVQPVKAARVMEAESLFQGREAYTLFQPVIDGTEPRLRPVQAAATADHVVLNDGERFEVVIVQDWLNFVIPNREITVRSLYPINGGGQR